MEEMKMDKTFENPNVTYKPSGLLGNSALTTSITYALFIILGAVLMQAPIAVVSGLAGALIALGGGTTLQNKQSNCAICSFEPPPVKSRIVCKLATAWRTM